MNNQKSSRLQGSKIIEMLEDEMLPDVTDFDVPPVEEHLIDINTVREWYFNTEKVIRVLGNLFSSPIFQSVNQLRYAGHHILKAETPGISDKERRSNLIEAFKHCKRALYDAFDFYIYKLNEYYRTLIPYFDSDRVTHLEKQMADIIREITDCRNKSKNRINYYSGVQNSFLDGLKIIGELNAIQRESGISEAMLKARQVLVYENAQLRNERNALGAENVQYRQQDGRRANILMVVLAVATFLGIIFGAAFNIWWPSKHELAFTNPVSTTSSISNAERIEEHPVSAAKHSMKPTVNYQKDKRSVTTGEGESQD